MGYAEDITNLRRKMIDAVAAGAVSEDSKDTFEATLLQIMNEAERNRQNAVNQAENLRRQASMIDGQVQAFSSVSSIVYSVIAAFVKKAEQAEEESKRRNAEIEEAKLLEKQEADATVINTSDLPLETEDLNKKFIKKK